MIRKYKFLYFYLQVRSFCCKPLLQFLVVLKNNHDILKKWMRKRISFRIEKKNHICDYTIDFFDLPLFVEC